MNERALILDFQITLHDCKAKPVYEYDNNRHLNVIELDGQKVPFINLEKLSVELDTKTRVSNEQDDAPRFTEILTNNPTSKHILSQLLNLETKTKVKVESDDFHCSLIELETKTFVKNESDDQKDSYHNQ